jgi:hypothetical protein
MITRPHGSTPRWIDAPPDAGNPGTIGVYVSVRIGCIVAVAFVCCVDVEVDVDMTADVVVEVVVGIVGDIDVDIVVEMFVGVVVAVDVDVAVDVTVDVTVDVAVDVFICWAVQIGPKMVFVSKVTAPFCAKARPFKLVPVLNVIDATAKIFPINAVVVSRVAELPTLHHTLQGSPPVTEAPGDVMSVEAALKIQTPSVPMRFKFPDNAKLLVEQYTPGPTPLGKIVDRSTAP